MSNRIVKLPSVESFGRLTPDKWLLLKTLEESAEMVEAGKRLVKGDATARRDLLAEWADVLQTLVNVATAFSITDEELAQAMDDCLVHNQERGTAVSIISSEAEHVYKDNTLLQEAYIAGATRQPTDEEIEAAIGEVRKFIMLPGGYLENIIRIAFNAARRKATEE